MKSVSHSPYLERTQFVERGCVCLTHPLKFGAQSKGALILREMRENKVLAGAILHGTEIKAFLLKRTRNPDVAEDIFQDLLVRFLTRGKTYSPENVKSYIFSAAANAVTDWARKTTRMNDLADNFGYLEKQNQPTESEIERSLIAQERLLRLSRALQELPERTQQIFTLARIKGNTHKETAKILGISIRTVERNLARALRHCMQKMKD